MVNCSLLDICVLTVVTSDFICSLNIGIVALCKH